MKTVLVMTTINAPTIAEDFCANFEKFGHKKDAAIIVIGDKKSPNEASHAIANKLKKRGFDVQYYDIAAQEQWLKRFPELAAIIPYNSDNRRNIGYLMAKEQGADVLISVDDDNFPLPDVDFIGGHVELIGKKPKLKVVGVDHQWFNVCDLLTNEKNERIFSRGFPYHIRSKYHTGKHKQEEKAVPVMLNMGLWVGDPDVDAITRIERNTRMTGFKNDRRVALALGTFAPINSQNTALHIDLLPAYYFVLMGEKVEGHTIDRYGDIWQGFFVKKVMDTLGMHAVFGEPLADHRRNSHNFFKDLRAELHGIMYTEYLTEFLHNAKLKGNTAAAVYADLADQLNDFVKKDVRFTDDFKAYIAKVSACQKIWLDSLAKISAS